MEKSVENLRDVENYVQPGEICGKSTGGNLRKICMENLVEKSVENSVEKSFFFLAIDRIRSMENLSGKSSGKIGDGKSERKTWKIRDAWKIYMENLLMTGKFGKLGIK